MDEVRSRREVEIRKIASRLREQYQKRMQTALQEMHIHYKVKMQQNSFKRSHYVYCEGESDNLTICVDDGLICCEHHSKLDEINNNKIKISQRNSTNSMKQDREEVWLIRLQYSKDTSESINTS